MVEALASGLPVIVSSKSGAREHIKNGVNGFVVESVEECINKINYLLSNYDIWKNFSAKAYESVKDLDMKKSYLDFLQSIASIGRTQ
ncbi:MAG: glycosyltransferase [Caldimicrobium sp.]